MMGSGPERTYSLILLLGFFYLLHSKAPWSVPAGRLIAIGPCRAKAVEVAFVQLFLANDGRNDLPEAVIA
jgi:hypothetical protein